MVAPGQVHLGELQAGAHREERQHERARRAGPHRPGELAVRLLQVAAVQARRAAAANASTLDRVVVHPMLVDDRERHGRRVRPPPPIARDPSPAARARPRRSTIVSVLPSARRQRGRLGEQRTRLVDVAGQQVRLGAERQSAVSRHGLHARLLGDRDVASAIICSGPAATHDGPQHGPRRVEGRRAVHGHQVERRGVDDAAHRCASAVCPVSTAIQPASTASGGYSSMAASPSADSHRCTVDIWPAL